MDGLRILIVEDDPGMRLVLRRMLEAEPDVEIVEIDDGRQAVETFLREKPDVVFLDIDLPGKSGIDIANELVDIDPKVVLIFATGYSDHMDEAFGVFAFDYLTKPYNRDRLSRTMGLVRQRLDERRAFEREKQSRKSGRDINTQRVVVTDGADTRFVDLSDLSFISREDRKTVLVTSSERIATNEALSSLAKRLTRSFIQSHKGYIINLQLVRDLTIYGRHTFLVRFSNTEQTALVTRDKAVEIRRRFGLAD